MEQRAINNKYKNIQYYESKYISSKKQENEFTLINEKKYDYIIKRPQNNSKSKDNSNGSRNNDNMNNKYNMKNKNRNNYNNQIEQNYEDNNYNFEEYNNGGNISNNKNKYGMNSANNIIKYINNNNHSNNNEFLRNDPKKFSNVAKALRYLGSRDNSNIKLIKESNSEMKYEYKINKNNFKNENSTENINSKTENISSQNNIKRNLDIQMNYNNKKSFLINPGQKSNKNNKIWSNINKDLVPTKDDLNFVINNEEDKEKTPLKYKDRFYRKYYTEKNIEDDNNKINGGENNVNKFLNEEENYDTEENNKNFISYKIKIKDKKDLSKQKNEENSNLKKYKSNNNIKVSYVQGRRKNKDIKDVNLGNKNQASQNQAKEDKILNFANIKNTTNTKSSPNILINNNHQKEIKNLRSPREIKDTADNTQNNSKNGKNNFNLPEDDKSSQVNKNVPLYQMNSKISKDNKGYENPVKKIFIEKNKYNKVKNEKGINDIENNKMNEQIKELKQIMNQNKKSNARVEDSNNENGLNVDNNNNNKIFQIHKNPFLFQQKNETNRIVFHKKINKSPIDFQKKANITNDNIEKKENIKQVIKINYRNIKNNNIINNVKIPTEKDSNIDNNKIKIQYEYRNIDNCLNREDKNEIKKDNDKSYNKINEPSVSNGIGNNGTVYKRHKALKKLSLKNLQTKNKLDNNINEEIKVSKKNKIETVKRNNIYNNNEYIDNFTQEKIKDKIILRYKKVIKYYDFFISCPKITKCLFTNTFFKNIKYPKIDICQISKFNSVVYVLHKNKNICYITKTREIIKKITQPPINSICEYSKNIILYLVQSDNNNEKNNIQENKVELNKQAITTTKKTKKRKKRRKTRRLHKEDTNEKNNCLNSLTEAKRENTDITSKELSKEENDKEKEKNIFEKTPYINPESNINLNNININIKTPEEINIISIPKKLMTNDKSSQEERSAFSEKEILIDVDKNSNSIKKKLSPTTYNDEEFNEEENDDFRIASDDDYLSEDKIQKKQFDTFDKFENGKTEGKEIVGDFESEKNKMKYKEGFKLLEKLSDKRIMNDFNENEEEDNYNDYNNIQEDYENNEESEGNNYNQNYNYKKDDQNLNKNIILGADKLNLIFNSQKNYKFTSDEDNENENDNFDDIYNDNNINENNSEKEINNDIIDKRKNLTYKNKYEKIGSIFDKLEEIFDKKKEQNNILDINLDKCKTPILNKDLVHIKNRISDFILQEEDYINDENIENESSQKKKNTYNGEDKKMNKYQEILNEQQNIISKLELLMNKPKSKLNQENSNIDNMNNNKIFNYNSPKIELETDSDIIINKDTPGNRKEIRLFKLQTNPKINKIYSLEEIFSYKNIDISKKTSLLPNDVLSHCDSMIKTIKEEYSAFKVNYKEIKVNLYNEPKVSMDKWARKDMTKEIEKAEKYVKELNIKMSNDNYRYKIIEILNTLTVDNYKNILNNLFTLIFLEENKKENIDTNNNKNLSLKNYVLNKPEYLLHNQFVFIEIILEKATKEKGYVILYAKLCADLFIEFIKYIKEINNPEIENQLINGENLKTILTSECRQKFDECISMETLYKDKDNEDKKEIFLIFKKKFLGNMDFIAELINVKLLSQTKGFEFLDILYKRYCEINDEKIKYLNLEGAVILLAKFGKIVFDRKNPKHLQNLDNYLNDNLSPIIEKGDNNLPNYLRFKIINLIEKKKNNWKDSLFEQSITAKGKNNNNLSIYHEHDGANNNINIDESLMDNSNKNIIINNNTNIDIDLEKENNIIILIKNDLENYVSFLNENKIFSLKDLNEKDIKGNINNKYDWSVTDDLIIKEKNSLEEIIRCFIEVCIDYVQKEQNIFYCNEYIKNIINYYSFDLSKEQIENVRNSMIDLFLNIDNICIDNIFMVEIMGYLLLLLLDNYLFYIEDLDIFINADKNKVGKIMKVVKITMDYYSEDIRKEFIKNFGKTIFFENNKDLLPK